MSTRLTKAAASLLLAACTTATPSDVASPSTELIPTGGTLRVGIGRTPSPVVDPTVEIDFGNELWGPAAIDPSLTGFIDSAEVFRCCLTRTLMAFPGRPTREGGGIAQPDLASGPPEVSDDGLTWTFRLRPDTRYGPPLQDTTVRAQDVITALERAAAGGGSYYFGVIEGYPEFAAGESSTITGLEAPDDLTLRVHLTAPSGDLADRFSVPGSAPIPPLGSDVTAPFGVATGHDDGYGGFLVSTGPYMLDGSDALDFAQPPAQRRPASGWDPGRSITLVRNPNWARSQDPLRGAYVDRIVFSFHDSMEDAASALDAGQIDLVWYAFRPPQAPRAQIDRYRGDPSLGLVSVERGDAIQAVWLNLAVPPLDDIHVRRAMNLVLDKGAIQELMGGPDAIGVAGHIGLDSQENDLLVNYDPYSAPGQMGDLEAARAEMALSRYDSDGDGRCDDPSCAGLTALSHGALNPLAEPAALIANDFEQIGIELDLVQDGIDAFFEGTARAPVALTVAWTKAFPNASDWFTQFSAGSYSYSLGLSPEELADAGYSVTEVPSVDGRIAACLTEVGAAQLRCWADLDQHLMENVVPWIPYASLNMINVVPARVVGFSFSQATSLPALDQIAVAP